MRNLLASLRTRIGGDERGDPGDGLHGGSRPSTGLYSCPECETTFISEELQSCPTCDGALDPTPNEFDLGLVTDGSGERDGTDLR